jgi:GNAT superfamily N-acetyltransferase
MIRAFRDSDYPEIAAVLRSLRVDGLYTERGVRHVMESMPPRAEPAGWVADDGGIVGWAFAHRRWWRASNTAYGWAGVLPGARRRGLGRALWEAVERHVAALGVEGLFTDTLGDEAGERLVRARGFERDRVDHISVVDPRAVDLSELQALESRARAAGYELGSLAAVELKAFYRLQLQTGDDMPGGDAPHEFSFDEWRRELVEHPELDWAGSAVVLRDDVPVAHALLTADLGVRRARNEDTGTARDHRRRGLATLAKLAAIRWAVAAGIERIVTDNTAGNVGMLAINRRLGYRPVADRVRWTRAS